jgi:hypothetical protein
MFPCPRDGALLQLAAIFFPHDHFPQRLGHNTNFVDRRATLITGLPAMIATFAAHELCSELTNRETQFQARYSGWIFDLSQGTPDKSYDEPLRDERFHYRSEQKWFDVHVEQSRDATDGSHSYAGVLKTRWPVMAARIAMSAVSTSRISPTITTFGSCRKM